MNYSNFKNAKTSEPNTKYKFSFSKLLTQIGISLRGCFEKKGSSVESNRDTTVAQPSSQCVPKIEMNTNGEFVIFEKQNDLTKVDSDLQFNPILVYLMEVSRLDITILGEMPLITKITTVIKVSFN